ncbi:27448_t:CDS:2, partial [Gigaspora margarita]
NKTLSNQESYESDSEESDKLPSTNTKELWYNASAQKSSLEKQKAAKKKLAKLNNLYHIAQDSQLHHDFLALEENSKVIRYDSPGSASQKRRKEIIKVCTTLHLKTEMEERYKIYILHSCFNMYLWPQHINSLSAKQYHYPIAIQDDKAKVLLDVLAVERTFKTIQSDNEPVAIPDHDFSKANFKFLYIPNG